MYCIIFLHHINRKRVFVLGPSHHAYLTKCALSCMTHYETPIGNIALDTERKLFQWKFNEISPEWLFLVISELYATGSFEWMKKSVDEEEHSIEMQLPYIEKMMNGYTNFFTEFSLKFHRASYALVPVLVGSLSKKMEDHYGSIFAKYLDDPSNFFVISSDFCHWGKRFDYMYYDVWIFCEIPITLWRFDSKLMDPSTSLLNYSIREAWKSSKLRYTQFNSLVNCFHCNSIQQLINCHSTLYTHSIIHTYIPLLPSYVHIHMHMRRCSVPSPLHSSLCTHSAPLCSTHSPLRTHTFISCITETHSPHVHLCEVHIHHYIHIISSLHSHLYIHLLLNCMRQCMCTVYMLWALYG